MISHAFCQPRLLIATAMALMGFAHVACAQELKPIKIGWQPTTTVEAQIAHTLAKTDILEKNGLKAEMTMFSFGPAVIEALVSGAIDVGFIGDMPSVSLAAAGGPITVIARQSTFRGSIIASTNCWVDLEFSPIGFDPERFHAAAVAGPRLHRNS